MPPSYVKESAHAEDLSSAEREFLEALGGVFAAQNDRFKSGELKFEVNRGASKSMAKLDKAKGERMLLKPRKAGESKFVVHIGTPASLSELRGPEDPSCWWEWDPIRLEWVLVGEC